MWNSQSPLNLLLSMPSTLSQENLQNLQEVIDVDKIINSRKYNRDLCGEYAPFCDFCNKCLKYPCAHAYVKMKQSDGLDVEIDETAEKEMIIEVKEEKLVEIKEAEEPAEPTPIIKEQEPAVEEKKKEVIRIARIKRTH